MRVIFKTYKNNCWYVEQLNNLIKERDGLKTIDVVLMYSQRCTNDSFLATLTSRNHGETQPANTMVSKRHQSFKDSQASQTAVQDTQEFKTFTSHTNCWYWETLDIHRLTSLTNHWYEDPPDFLGLANLINYWYQDTQDFQWPTSSQTTDIRKPEIFWDTQSWQTIDSKKLKIFKDTASQTTDVIRAKIFRGSQASQTFDI